MSVITRFAPSPTGYLHIGGVRTALYSWLYAKRHGGKFVLRVEDTDRERSTPEAVAAILEGMQWLGLVSDEPAVFQSERNERYQTLINQLLAEGKAYKCFMLQEELDAIREAQKAKGEKPRYPGTWRDRTDHPDNEPYVIRFKNPVEGSVIFKDHIRGEITVSNAELDDLVIQRADGSPTYNFCVVVDDWDMGITHVVRGEDHVNNTPRQINILKALGAPVPEYAHVSMILGEDGKKLSKRRDSVNVLQYRDEGYLPEAILNYLVRLGWSHGDQEIFSISEMCELFDLHNVSVSASAMSHEKLLWLNQHYLQNLPLDQLTQQARPYFAAIGLQVNSGADLAQVVDLQRERVKTLVEMAEISRYFFEDITEFDAGAAKKHLRPVALPPLNTVKSKLAALPDWTETAIAQAIDEAAAELEVGMGKVGMPLRVAVTGGGNSPALDRTLVLFEKDIVLVRIDRAIAFVEARIAAS